MRREPRLEERQTGLEAEYTLRDDASVGAHGAAELGKSSELLGAFLALSIAQRAQDLLTTL